MKEKKEPRIAEIRLQIEFCSQCPKSRVSPVYWNPEFDEEDQDVYCTELGRGVHKALHWNEIKTRHQCQDPKYDNSMDFVPEDCPFIKKGISKQMEDIWKE